MRQKEKSVKTMLQLLSAVALLTSGAVLLVALSESSPEKTLEEGFISLWILVFAVLLLIAAVHVEDDD